MENKNILKAFEELHAEKMAIITLNTKRAGVLVYQIMSFNKMHKSIQEEVIEELFHDMKKLGWNDWVEDLKKELNSEKADE